MQFAATFMELEAIMLSEVSYKNNKLNSLTIVVYRIRGEGNSRYQKWNI